MSAEDTSEVVGKSVGNGVVARVRAKEGTKCRGAINGNDSPQSGWVFSTDACGAYGMEHLTIVHAGGTQPEGTIVVASEMRIQIAEWGWDAAAGELMGPGWRSITKGAMAKTPFGRMTFPGGAGIKASATRGRTGPSRLRANMKAVLL
jgi:hypothetical protein